MQESIESTPLEKIRRHISPPPIRGPGGKFEGYDSKSPNGPSNRELLQMISELKIENRRLKGQVAEGKLDNKDLRDEFETFRRGTYAKIKRFAKALGVEDIF